MRKLVNSILVLVIAITISCRKDDPAVKTFQFYLSAKAYSDQSSQADLTTSHISVTSGRVLFDGDGAAAANKITVDDGNVDYAVTVTKANYITYTKTFTLDQLKAFTQDSPLVITMLDQSLTNGVVACYSLNGNARDCSGNFNDGTIIGTTSIADRLGSASSAYRFNGTSDYVSLPAHALKNNNYSYSVWIKVNAIPASGNASNIFSIGDVTDLKHQAIALGNNYSSSSFTGLSAGGYNNGTPTTTSAVTGLPVIGQWYHIVSTRSNTAMTLYVNGDLVNTASTNGTTPYYGTTVAANIGTRCSLTQYFNGDIDNLVIYNRAITGKEVKILYLEGIPCQ